MAGSPFATVRKSIGSASEEIYIVGHEKG